MAFELITGYPPESVKRIVVNPYCDTPEELTHDNRLEFILGLCRAASVPLYVGEAGSFMFVAMPADDEEAQAAIDLCMDRGILVGASA